MKRLAAALVLAAIPLAACKQAAPSAQPADPEAKPGISVAHGRLVLPAVSGNPGAAYFDLANAGNSPAVLAAVHVAGSDAAEMHETMGANMSPVATLAIAPGETARFAPGGRHVMVFGLAASVAAGSTTEMTLTFADGDKLSAMLAVEPPGGAEHHR